MREPAKDTARTSQLRLVIPALRVLRLPRGRVLALAALAFVSGLGTASTLVLLINVGLRLTGTDGATAVLGIDLGGLSTGVLFGAALVAACLVFVVDLLAARQSARIITAVQLRLRTALFEAYNGADWVTQSADPPGHLQELMSMNVGRAVNLTTAVNGGLVAILALATMVGIAAVINPVTTGVLIAALGALIAVLSPLATRIRTAAERTRAANHAYALGLAEITGVPTEVRTFGVGDAADERHRVAAADVAHTLGRLTWLEKAIPSGQRNLALITVLAVLALLHGAGVAGPEELGSVVVLLGRSITYVHAIQQTVNKFASAGPFVFALDDEITRYRAHDGGDTRSSRPSTVDLDPVAVRLDGVTYRHPAAEQCAVEGVSLAIDAGTYLALVGPSGSGKTTLAEIILGLRRPSAGRCTIGDDAPTDLAADERARTVAFVPQSPATIRGTVADNVRFLRTGISDADVVRAMTDAGLTDASGGLLVSPDEVVGEDARSFSGGQLQRLAIARALAGRPRLIVLDEPTSALDPDAEAALSDTLGRLAGSVTLIVIAHRPATIEGCDRVVVLDAGAVVADDTPAAVAASNAFWQRGFETAGPRA
ncbi:MAG: ABC transporter ATP-binding protein [Acidimicrobiales bacterium]|nr:ABC transporter ATP-binding protein [Acidimicrobiales bacterium]